MHLVVQVVGDEGALVGAVGAVSRVLQRRNRINQGMKERKLVYLIIENELKNK